MPKAQHSAIATNFPLEWQWDTRTSAFSCNQLLPKLLGLSIQASVKIEHLYAAVENEQLSHLKKIIKQVHSQKQIQELRIILQIHHQRHLAHFCIWSEPEEPDIIQGTLEVMMQLPSRTQELNLLHNFYNRGNEGVLVSDQNHRIIMANRAFCMDTGYSEFDILGESASFMKTQQCDDSFYQKMWEATLRQGSWHGELVIRTKCGEISPRELKLYHMVNEQTQSDYYVGVSRQLGFTVNNLIDESEPDPTHIELVSTDQLIKQLNQRLKEVKSDQTLVHFMLGINFTTTMSESTQHWLIAKHFSTLPEDIQFARVGDNLFSGGVIVPYKVRDIHKRLQQVINQLCRTRDNIRADIPISANLGASVLRLDATNSKQLVNHAGQALVASKTSGVNNISYFDDKIQKATDREQVLTKLLRRAIDEKNIQVYYQPIVDLRTLTTVKVEALLRINSKEAGPNSIKEMVTIAEQKGWIDELDHLVAQQALKDLPLLQCHYGNEQLQLSINRSMVNDRVERSSLETTLALIEQSGISPCLITVELTETTFLEESTQQAEWVEKLRHIGVHVAINDFGCSNSSLSSLKHSSVDQVKIDRSFTKELTIDSREYLMIKSLTALVHQLGGEVVAGGIENSSSLKLLSLANVNYGQGHLFSHPKPLAEIIDTPPSNQFPEFESLLSKTTQPTARELMRTDIPRVDMDDKIDRAKELLMRSPTDFLLVTSDSCCQGLLFKADLNEALSPYLNTDAEQQRDLLTLNKRVHQVMTKSFITVASNLEATELKTTFIRESPPALIVTGTKGVCLGVITASDLLKTSATYSQANVAS